MSGKTWAIWSCGSHRPRDQPRPRSCYGRARRNREARSHRCRQASSALRLGIRELTQGARAFALVFGPAALVLGETAFVGSPSARKLRFSAFDAGGTPLDLLPSLIELRATGRKLSGSTSSSSSSSRTILFGENCACASARCWSSTTWA